MTHRIALVTGGMGGIGTAICRRLAQAGHVVVANGLPGDPRKDAWLAEQRKAGFAQIHVYDADVSDFAATGAMVQNIVAELGPIEIVINNAGIIRDNVMRRMPVEDWLAVLNSNLSSAWFVTKHVIDSMTERGWGRVINISSVNGQKGQFGQTNYSAAKAGLHGFAKALAQEVIRKGVTVNSVSPGYVATDMVKAIRPDVLDKLVASIPIGRLAEPAEIAALVGFLASEEAGYITGANIAINGGMYMV